MCGDCPNWRAWFCGIKGDCNVLKSREDRKPPEQRAYGYGTRWTFKDDACKVALAVKAS